MNTNHQINETHLGTDATPEDARTMAEILTKMGYPSEYTSTSGGRTSLRDEENDEDVEIPQTVWNDALVELVSEEDL